MSQPQYPQPQQPGWGGQQPGFGAPQPQPQPPKKPVGKIVGLGCLGVVVLFVLIGIAAALGGGDGDKNEDNAGTAKNTAPTAAAPEKTDAAVEPEPTAEAAPVKITAKKTTFSKSVLADGSDYTSVKITITNNSGKAISVNPLYFSITDNYGTRHEAELGVDEQQIDTANLAPGENMTGTVTGKGGFTPKYVTYTENLFGDPMRANVS
ncbi:DUF4352 domain-containing protein [Streptomyces sp. NPDC004726]